MSKEVLILIDIQNIYFTPGPMPLHKPKCYGEGSTVAG